MIFYLFLLSIIYKISATNHLSSCYSFSIISINFCTDIFLIFLLFKLPTGAKHSSKNFESMKLLSSKSCLFNSWMSCSLVIYSSSSFYSDCLLISSLYRFLNSPIKSSMLLLIYYLLLLTQLLNISLFSDIICFKEIAWKMFSLHLFKSNKSVFKFSISNKSEFIFTSRNFWDFEYFVPGIIST